MELRDDPHELRDDPKPGWRLRDWTPPGCSVLLMVSQDCTYLQPTDGRSLGALGVQFAAESPGLLH